VSTDPVSIIGASGALGFGLAVRLGRGRYDFVEPMFGEYVRRLDEGLVRGTVATR